MNVSLTKFLFKFKRFLKNNSPFPTSLPGFGSLSPRFTMGQAQREEQPPQARNNIIKGSASRSSINRLLKPEVKIAKYTGAEVKRYLRGFEVEKDGRAKTVRQEASTFTFYLETKIPSCLRGRERIFEKLPLVLFQYSQGKPTAEIAKAVSYLADHEDIEAAMDYVSEIIANRVNYRLVASRSS